jgi:hypothetical protein
VLLFNETAIRGFWFNLLIIMLQFSCVLAAVKRINIIIVTGLYFTVFVSTKCTLQFLILQTPYPIRQYKAHHRTIIEARSEVSEKNVKLSIGVKCERKESKILWTLVLKADSLTHTNIGVKHIPGHGTCVNGVQIPFQFY